MESYSKPGGQNVDILNSIINKTEYSEEPRSQISELLLELKEAIESGGGGTSAETAALLIDNAAKNLLPLTLEGIKKASESDDGTWDDNVYSENGINFAIATDDVERVTSITVSQTAGAATGSLSLVPSTIDPETLDIIYDPTYSAGNYIFSVGGNLPEGVDLVVSYEGTSGSMMQYVHDEAEITLAEGSGCLVGIYVRSITIESGEPVIFDDFVIHPMLRRADTNADFEVGYMTQKQLDAAVRELQKSGGGEEGSGYTETVLWTNPTSGYPSPQGSVEIIDNIMNYDVIYVVGGTMSNNVFAAATIGVIPVSEFVKGEEFLWEYDNLYYGTNYIDENHVHLGGVATGGRTIAFKKVIGIKYGGGSGSGDSGEAYSETVLYDGGTTANVGEITLSQNALNFDLLVALFGKADGSSFANIIVRGEPDILNDNGWQQEYGPVGWYISNGGSTFGWNNGNAMYPRKIVGINYGGNK